MLWPVCALKRAWVSERRCGAPANGSARQPRDRQLERLYNRSLPAPPRCAAAPPRPGAAATAAACRHVPSERGLHGGPASSAARGRQRGGGTHAAWSGGGGGGGGGAAAARTAAAGRVLLALHGDGGLRGR